MNGTPLFCFTSDLDWASDYCIRDLRSILDRFGIRPTLFVTHRSAEVESWQGAELGIHPNFFQGSSHGSSTEEVIDSVLALVPGAESFRCHKFFDSSPVTEAMRQRGLRYDSNLCLHLQPDLVPLRHQSGLIRFPVFFEDDCGQNRGFAWDGSLEEFFTPGLKILNFHPFMLATNCHSAASYASVRGHVRTLDESTTAGLRYSGPGERTLLLRLLEEIKSRGFRFFTLGELFRRFTDTLPADQVGRQSRHSDDDYRRYWSMSESERQEFVRSSYEQRDATDLYATSRDYNARELEIQSLTQHVRPGRILDLGCGNGFTLIRLAEKLTNCELTGVDFSENLITGARALAARSGFSGLPAFLRADAVEYIAATPEESVDTVITERFIQNLPSEEKQRAVMSLIFRALRPGGHALICEGSTDGFEELNDLREAVGLARIPATSMDNITAIRLQDTGFESFCSSLGFTLAEKCGYSWFFVMARVLHPLLVAPQAPQFNAKINDLARLIQAHLPFDPRYGGNTLWVLKKPEGAEAGPQTSPNL